MTAKKNPQTPNEQFDSVIAQLDIQISDANNTIPIQKISEDSDPSSFTNGTDIMADLDIQAPFMPIKPIKGNPEPTVLPEMQPFNKEIPIDEAQLRKNVGMAKMGKIDDVAKGEAI